MIDIANLSKVYRHKGKEVVAVDNVSLTIPDGQIFGVLGQSGAGKTTLMRCMTALERPTSGSLTIGSTELTSLNRAGLRAIRHRMGMIFQYFNLLGSRTAADNIAFPLEIQGMSSAQRKERVGELLELVGLSDRAHSYPSQLSGGQKQRVGIARALAARPQVLFCDEATSALDPSTTEQILDLLKTINESTGVTIVLITHESEVVRRICDAAALMSAGQIIEKGNLDELIAQPGSRLADILLPLSDLPGEHQGNSAILTFAGSSTTEPVISGLTRRFNLDVSIIGGAVDTIAGKQVGRLRVHLTHPDKDFDREAVRSYLASNEVDIEL